MTSIPAARSPRDSSFCPSVFSESAAPKMQSTATSRFAAAMPARRARRAQQQHTQTHTHTHTHRNPVSHRRARFQQHTTHGASPRVATAGRARARSARAARAAQAARRAPVSPEASSSPTAPAKTLSACPHCPRPCSASPCAHLSAPPTCTGSRRDRAPPIVGVQRAGVSGCTLVGCCMHAARFEAGSVGRCQTGLEH